MGAHQVDLSGAAEEIAAAQPGHDAAGAVVDRHHRDLGIVCMLAALVGDELAERRLELQADRRRHGGAGRLAGQPGRRCGAFIGIARRCVWHRPARRLVVQRAIDHAMLEAARQHAVAAGLRGGGGAIGPAALGDCGMATSSAASAALSCRGSLPK